MSTVRMGVVISKELKEELDAINQGDIGETMSKALMLYILAKKRTTDGKTKLGFYDHETKQIVGEIAGL